MFVLLHVKYWLVFFSDFNQLDYSRNISEKYPRTKFHENPSNGNPVAPCGRTDMKKLIFAISQMRQMMWTTSKTPPKKQGVDSEQTSTDLQQILLT
jgi:hypothetical protein